MPSNSELDWRAVGTIVALLVGMFTLTTFLTDDKINSAVQKHSIETEATHARDFVIIKEDIASLKTSQKNVKETTERLEQQNIEILRRIEELRRNQ
jgi:hypothetical protein